MVLSKFHNVFEIITIVNAHLVVPGQKSRLYWQK